MNITVNGEETTLEAKNLTVDRLLEELEVDMPGMVSVELNDEIVSRSKHDETAVSDGDRIEFLYFMGGG